MEAYSSQNPPFSESTRPPPVTYPAAFGVWCLELLWCLELGAWDFASLPRAQPNHKLLFHFTYIHLHSLTVTYFFCTRPSSHLHVF